jgi:hypothetical protein
MINGEAGAPKNDFGFPAQFDHRWQELKPLDERELNRVYALEQWIDLNRDRLNISLAAETDVELIRLVNGPKSELIH